MDNQRRWYQNWSNFGICAVLLTLLVTILVLFAALEEKTIATVTVVITREASTHQGGCSANSFMIGDGVCDELTNIERCQYDGGDCCLRNSSRSLCSVCICRMLIDSDYIYDIMLPKFNAMALQNPYDFESLSKTYDISLTRTETHETCSTLCMDAELETKVNSWKYNKISKNCTCAWVDHISNKTKLKQMTTTEDNQDVAMLQMDKMMYTECFLLGVKYVAQDPLLVESVPSAWKCNERCLTTPDCQLFSYRKYSGVSSNINCFLYGSGHENEDWKCKGWPLWMVGWKKCNQSMMAGYCIYKETLLLVATGITKLDVDQSHNSFASDIEVINLEWTANRCNFTKAKSSQLVRGAAGAVFASDGILLCGGSKLSDFTPSQWELNNQCSMLGDISQDPLLTLSSNEGQSWTGHVLNHGSSNYFFLLDAYSNTELIQWGTKNDSNESNLNLIDSTDFLGTQFNKYWCTCKIDESNILMMAQSFFWNYNINYDQWTPTTVADLTLGNFYCGCLDEPGKPGSRRIVITGGIDMDVRLDKDPVVNPTKTHIVTLESYPSTILTQPSSWNEGPVFPTFLARASSVSHEDSLFIVGGHDANDVMQTKIYRFSCQSLLDCSWVVMEQELAVGRADSVALIIPNNFADCA